MSSLQQINLFVPELRPQKQPFSLSTMLAAWGVMLLFFALLQTWGWYQIQTTQDQLSTLELRQVQVLQQLEDMRNSTPRNKNTHLDANIRKVQAEVDRRRQVLSIMKGKNTGNVSGFSHYLVGLSRQAMDGVSLEYFGLLQGGNYVELSGWTHRAELVPGYLQRLRGENSFRSARFGDMAIEQLTGQRNDVLRFRLGEAAKGGS